MPDELATPIDAAPDHTAVPEPEAELLLRAQAIDCGEWPLAVGFDWARAVVEEFHVSPAPNAPPWLAGAVNVEGRILPVLDPAAWLDERKAQVIDRNSRLLVGGEGEDSFAILFRGLPMMVRYASGNYATPVASSPSAPVPVALAPYIVGSAQLPGPNPERHWPVINARALAAQWASELVA